MWRGRQGGGEEGMHGGSILGYKGGESLEEEESGEREDTFF